MTKICFIIISNLVKKLTIFFNIGGWKMKKIIIAGLISLLPLSALAQNSESEIANEELTEAYTLIINADPKSNIGKAIYYSGCNEVKKHVGIEYLSKKNKILQSMAIAKCNKF